jgi:DNA-directed RNA polymerase specialized sigma24 family protein
VEPDRRIDYTVRRDRARLRSFIRRRVADDGDAEEILQKVFAELV